MFSYPGVDFKLKMLTVGGKRLKLTMWDTGYIYDIFSWKLLELTFDLFV